MVVNDSLNYLFVHIPKTAGQSVSSRLEHVHPVEFRRHMTALEISRELDFSRYFSFTFVRNPWARLYSIYTFLCQKRLKRHLGEDWNQWALKWRGFKWWLTENEWYPPYARGKGGLPRQKEPQQHSIIDEQGQVMVDFVGRVENIDADFQELSERLGFPFRPLPRIHATRHKPYREAYDQEMIDFVAAHHAVDIESFDYEF